MKIPRIRNYFFSILLLASLLLPLVVMAVEEKSVLENSLLSGVACAEYGSQEACKLCDMIRVLVNASNIMVGISGVLAMLIFIYAGFMYLTVSIKPDHAAKAKSALTAAVVGIMIIFGAYTVVNFILSAFGGSAGMGTYQAAYYNVTGKSDWGVCVEPEAKAQ